MPASRTEVFDYEAARRDGMTDDIIEQYVQMREQQGVRVQFDQENVRRGQEIEVAQKQQPEQAPKSGKSVGGFLGNVGKSALQLFGGTVEAAVHPIQTGKALGGIALGAAEKLIPGEQKGEQAFNAFIESYKQRYGSAERIGETLYRDPAGALADVSALASGAGATIRGVGRAVSRPAITEAGRALTSAGRAVEPITAPTRGAAAVAPFIQSGLTNVPRTTFRNIFSEPDAARAAREIVAAAPENPYLAVAQQTVDSLNALEQSSRKMFTDAARQFAEANPGRTFDVSQKVTQLADVLKGEPGTGFNLNLEQVTKGGKVTSGYRVVPSKQSPFSAREIAQVQELVDTMRASKNVKVQDLLDLSRKFNAAYDAIPLGVNGQPRPYHALIMQLTEKADELIAQQLPKELRNARSGIARAKEVDRAFGNNLRDAQGKVKTGSETFIQRLSQKNQGVLREKVSQYAKDIGVDLVKLSEAIRDAQRTSGALPATGARGTDILRSLGVGKVTTALGAGAGAALGGPGGAAVGGLAGLLSGAAMSPAIHGRITELAGQAARTGVGRVIGAAAKATPTIAQLLTQYARSRQQR